MFITTLPITPTKESKATRFVSPLIADILSQLLGIPFYQLINSYGMKTTLVQNETIDWAHHYESQLGQLGIYPKRFLHDGDLAYADFFQNQLDTLRTNQSVRSTKKELTWCPCGRVEIPTQTMTSIIQQNRTEKSLIEHDTEGTRCVICKNSLSTSVQEVEILNLTQTAALNFFPKFYAQQIAKNVHLSSTIDTIISRHHRNTLLFDTEFQWLPFLDFLGEKNEPVILVVSNTVLPKAIKCLLFMQLLCPEQSIHLIVHPIVRIQDRRIPLSELTIESFRTACGTTENARTFLSLGIQWNEMETKLASTDLHWAQVSLPHVLPTNQPALQSNHLLEAMNLLHRNNILNILKKVRSKEPLSQREHSLLSAITRI